MRQFKPKQKVARISFLSPFHNKKRTFVYQKFSFCLSIAKAMAYHHASACISSPQEYIINRRLFFFHNDDKQNFGFMIYNFREIDDIQGNALIYLQNMI